MPYGKTQQHFSHRFADMTHKIIPVLEEKLKEFTTFRDFVKTGVKIPLAFDS